MPDPPRPGLHPDQAIVHRVAQRPGGSGAARRVGREHGDEQFDQGRGGMDIGQLGEGRRTVHLPVVDLGERVAFVG